MSPFIKLNDKLKHNHWYAVGTPSYHYQQIMFMGGIYYKLFNFFSFRFRNMYISYTYTVYIMCNMFVCI